MAEHISEVEGVLQEWCPQTRLLQQIPQKAQRGLFTQDLNLTCVDAVPEYIALGTNSGLVYWYNRKNGELQRLRCENTSTSITCVTVVSTVDFMVAAGTVQGVVTVFQIPKTTPDSVPDVLKPKNKQVERYTISGLHTSSISAIEWSQNGMKLFSGDKNGLVVLTEFDFYMHLSKSCELLNEQFEIVQLNYCQQLLVISTLFRSIVAHQNEKWRVSQVGTKERKTLGRYGATFCKFNHGTVLYSCRPGQRVWLCEKDGAVQQTLIFKEAVTSPHSKIQLINPANKIDFYDKNFGKIVQFGDSMLVVFNEDMLYVLHPGAITVVAVLDCVRKILDVAVTKDEIFVLEGKRSLLRIGYGPDMCLTDECLSSINSTSTPSSSSLLDELTSKLKDTAKGSFHKVKSEDEKTMNLTFHTSQSQSDQISPTQVGDEAVELPPVVPLPTGSITSLVPSDKTESQVDEQQKSHRQQMLDRISEQQFDEVVFRSTKRRRDKKKRNTAIFQGQESESDTVSTASEEQQGSTDESQSQSSSNNHTQSSYSFLRDIPTLLKTAQHQQPNVMSDSDIRHNDELCRKYSEIDKTPDDKSQGSIDTCESASENLVLTPDAFKQEQEKTFARLAANVDADDKTENMSVSMNMTPSSSVSSKISESLHITTSEMSENVSMGSVTKSETDDELPLPKTLCYYNVNTVESSSQSSSGASQKLNNDDEQLLHDKLIIAKNLDLPVDVLPDLRSSNVILKDLRKKERMLAKVLNVDLILSDNDSEGDENSSNSEKNVTCNAAKFVEDAEGLIANEVISAITTPRPSPLHGAVGKTVEGEDYESVEHNSSTQFGDHSEDLNDMRLEFYTSPAHEHEDDEFDDEDYKNLLPECEQDVDDKNNSLLSSLSYGPPSGSSNNPSFEYNSGVPRLIKTDPSDSWLRFQSPQPVMNLSVCNNYIVFADLSENVYFSGLYGLGLSWTLTDYKAVHVDVSGDGSLVWILVDDTAVALESPCLKGPISERTQEAAVKVKTFAVDNNNECWFVTLSGLVRRQRNLVRVPCGRSEDVKCTWIVNSIACNNGLVLATTDENELICKPKSDETFRRVKIPGGVYVSSVAVGPGQVCWLVDDKNCIHFTDNITDDEVSWWEVLISDYVYQNTPTPFQTLHNRLKLPNIISTLHLKNRVISACNTSVWVYDRMSCILHVNKTDINGYIWRPVKPKSFLPKFKWQAVSGEGVFEDKGHLWLLSTDGDIFCSKPNSQHFQSISSPTSQSPACIASCTDTLWLLTQDGMLYARLGLTDNNLTGNSWRELDLQQLCELHLNWISCGCDVVWVCDRTGRVFMAVGSPHDMATNMFQPAWLEVESKLNNSNHLVKVFVGPHLHMVWAIDNKNNVYVREAIFPDFPVGTGWVYVTGIEATHLSISSTCVWAQTPSGFVYKRFGITQNNYIGDYWKRIPGVLDAMTTSVDDNLWGVDKLNQLVQLLVKNVIVNPKVVKNDVVPSCEEGDWEVVH